MMIQNERLPSSIQSNIVIKLSDNAKKVDQIIKSYIVSKKMSDSFITYIPEFNKNLDPEEPIFVHELAEKIKELERNEQTNDSFSLKETITVMEQITEPIDILSRHTVMARGEGNTQRRALTKPRRCHGCGKSGHFALDNP